VGSIAFTIENSADFCGNPTMKLPTLVKRNS
jgi:hypothetical protein